MYYDNVFDESVNIFERSRSSYRTLVEMKGELPYDSDLGATPANTPEYQMVFLDENIVEVDAITPTPSRPWFNSAYILTNCGNSSTGENGWDNLALESSGLCDHLWASNEMCVGGWDTQLRRGDRGGDSSNEQAPISQFALFPDGKYVIDVTAQSSGTAFLPSQYQNNRSQLFPSSNVEVLDSDPEPIIVDNYIPYVDSIIVYEISTSLPQTLDIIYTAGWEENTGTGEAALRPRQVGYLSLTPSVSNLWIAVRYSEPMDVSINDVWITAEMEGENTWDSSSSGKFRPEPTTIFWPDEIGTLDTSRLAGGVWYLYNYRGSLPTEYKGRLTLHFDALDYAGNHLDGDPETICSPRNSDGSWNTQNYEEGPDASYTWGTCEWVADVDYENETGFFRAMVGETEIQRVTFEELEFSFWPGYIDAFNVLEQIPYSSGAYLQWLNGFINGDDIFCVNERTIKVVDGNGDIIGTTSGPKYVYSLQHHFHELDTWFSSSISEGIEWNNNYLWFRQREVNTFQFKLRSYESWWVVDGHSGESNHIPIGVLGYHSYGYYTPEDGYYYVNYNQPTIVYNGDGGYTTPLYYLLDEDSTQLTYIDDIYVSLSSDFSLFLSQIDSNTCSVPEIQYLFSLISIEPNPSSNIANIDFSIAEKGKYKISVFDISGRLIQELFDREYFSGNHSVVWNTTENEIPSGVYYVQLEGEGQREVKSIIVFN